VRGIVSAGVSAGVPEQSQMVLEDAGMRRLHLLAERAAAGNINVLIVGETGVGKEIMAETVHRLSPRAKAPSCASTAPPSPRT